MRIQPIIHEVDKSVCEWAGVSESSAGTSEDITNEFEEDLEEDESISLAEVIVDVSEEVRILFWHICSCAANPSLVYSIQFPMSLCYWHFYLKGN